MVPVELTKVKKYNEVSNYVIPNYWQQFFMDIRSFKPVFSIINFQIRPRQKFSGILTSFKRVWLKIVFEFLNLFSGIYKFSNLLLTKVFVECVFRSDLEPSRRTLSFRRTEINHLEQKKVSTFEIFNQNRFKFYSTNFGLFWHWLKQLLYLWNHFR